MERAFLNELKTRISFVIRDQMVPALLDFERAANERLTSR